MAIRLAIKLRSKGDLVVIYIELRPERSMVVSKTQSITSVNEEEALQTDASGFQFTAAEKATALAERKLATNMSEVKTFGQICAEKCMVYSKWSEYTNKKTGQRKPAGENTLIDPVLLSKLLTKASPRGYLVKNEEFPEGTMVQFVAGGNYGKSVKVEKL